MKVPAKKFERERILAENQRRERTIPFDSAEHFFKAHRRRRAETQLRSFDFFPRPETRCLEIGCGRCGWLPDLVTWGVRENLVCGIDIDLSRLLDANRELSSALFANADGCELPFSDETFDIVVVSTVFTSILDIGVRRRVASDIERVLATGGMLLWYDFAFDNPRNPSVRGIGRREIRSLFPAFEGVVRSITLAPPLARYVVPRSLRAAVLLERIPFLRTHLLGVLKKVDG